MTFDNFNLNPNILRALQEKGYTTATPVQQKAIPELLKGVDILASAQTGTGKTAAFCLPILQRLLERSSKRGSLRVLMLAPTRELAIQIAENLTFYGKYLPFRHALVYGGVSQFHQVKQIRQGVDIVVATPGRLKDLMDQRILSLKDIEILVLDEADRMLDMGFIHDVRKILSFIPAAAQKVMFSATVPEQIQHLAKSLLKNPVRLKTAETKEKDVLIHESVYYVERASKKALLKHIILEKKMHQVLVFTKTKFGADKIVKDLGRSGIIAEAIHGNKSQPARVRALTNFKDKTTRVLVATDIAARGIDIINLGCVINFELPPTTETYTHRIGRTGRAGVTGAAVSLCDTEERPYLRNIKQLSPRTIQVMEHPFQ